MITIPRTVLAEIPTAVLRGVLVTLLERADPNGQLLISVRSLADELHLSYQAMRTALAKLTANATINASSNAKLTQQATQRMTLVTICDFDSYSTPQRGRQRREQRKANAGSNAGANAADTAKKSSKFIPPTEAEVTAYCRERGYHFNPAEFVPFYQMRGWKMKGGEPMKDWKAGCRYWETNWKAKHGELFYYQIQPAASTADRANSRNQLRAVATGVVSQSADKLLGLYNGGGEDTDAGRD